MRSNGHALAHKFAGAATDTVAQAQALGHRLAGYAEHADVKAARGLGWASIAVGLTEIFAPKQLQRLMGVGDRHGENTGILRVLGVREIMHGVDILSHKDPTPGVYSRVAGDMLDGVLLGLAARKSRNPSGMTKVAAAVFPLVALDLLFAGLLGHKRHES